MVLIFLLLSSDFGKWSHLPGCISLLDRTLLAITYAAPTGVALFDASRVVGFDRLGETRISEDQGMANVVFVITE